jgi:hypothetical protein
MIERGIFTLPPVPGAHPGISASIRAVVSCGCMVLVGIRLDNGEHATSARACTDRHQPLVEEVTRRQIATIDDPATGALPVSQVADKFLTEVAKEWGIVG